MGSKGKKGGKVKLASDGVLELPKTRIELHAHLDGCIRFTTLYELLKEKKVKMPGTTLEDLKKEVIVKVPVDLSNFLAPFALFLAAVEDDFDAMERIAFEFAEDKANQNVLYAEARYCPHAFLSPEHTDSVTLGEVITSVQRGFSRAESEYGIKCRSILCTLYGQTRAKDVLDLFQMNRHKGLVGMDLASKYDDCNVMEEVPLVSEEYQVFQEAKKLGIHRTVHAGERGGAEMVRRAVEVYGAERIGHGYRVVEDKYVFKSCITKNIHFECCPWSSFLTGAVPLDIKKHPICMLAMEDANFSLSTDDTTVTGHDLDDDYALVQKWGFTEGLLVKSNFNALAASFLPSNEKKALLKQFKANLGVIP